MKKVLVCLSAIATFAVVLFLSGCSCGGSSDSSSDGGGKYKCSNCGTSLDHPKNWHGEPLCGSCYSSKKDLENALRKSGAIY